MVKKPQKSRKSSRGRMEGGEPNPVDVYVGSRVRLRRTLVGMSQEKLGRLLGLTFQQVQKYERGLNRISASRLWDISRVLDVPVSFFYDDMDGEVATKSPRYINVEGNDLVEDGLEEGQKVLETDPMARRETLELIRAYYRINDDAVQKNLFDLVLSLSKTYAAAISE